MKTTFVAMIIMLTSALLFAQTDTTGWGRNSRFNRMYDPKTMTEIKGAITQIEYIPPMRGMSTGVHLIVKSNGQNYSVHLGPKWYLDQQSVKLKEKDQISIKGSKVTIDGAPVIIARDITAGNTVLKLRDEAGIPAWSRGGKGRR